MTDFLRSGRVSVDLAWTVRFRRIWPTDVLSEPRELERWLRETYPETGFASRVCDEDLLVEAKTLREAIYSLIAASAGVELLATADRAVLNRRAAGPRFRYRLDDVGPAAPQVTTGDQFLTELAIDAIQVLSADRSRLKLCEGPDCALPFLDESRGATRRWCTAQRCGNRVNTKAYRTRARARS